MRAPLMGVVDVLAAELPSVLGDALRVYVGLTGVLILLTAATTSISGFGRLAYSLGEHDQLPRSFGRLHRRTLVAPQALVAAGAVSAITLVAVDVLRDDPVVTLASLYSFGVLVAFGAAQLAVIRLRFTQPELRRPFQVPGRRPRSRGRRPRPLRRRLRPHGRGDGRRALDAPGRALRRPDLARRRASSSTSSSAAGTASA